MLLRSITKHVKEQNWFAVFVDFLIVVVGILIAFQITNWSEQKSARNDYDLAIERYKAEIDANLEALDTLDAESSEVLLQVNTAFDVLLACKDNALIKSIYTWDRWQSAMPAVTPVLRSEFETMQEWLEK
tara:strand:+ start:147 stop:536 length:390 start_codon:yes stop_codon:yes gene_type:complete